MQVYHRRHYTCLPIWSDLSLPLLPLPFPPTALAPWDHPSDAKQLLTDEFRNSHRLVAEGSLRPGEHTHHCDWCHWTLPLFTSDRGPFAGHQLAKVPAQLHRVVTFQMQSSHFCFPLPCWGPAGWQTSLQLLRVPSNHCVLHLISFMYSETYRGV